MFQQPVHSEICKKFISFLNIVMHEKTGLMTICDHTSENILVLQQKPNFHMKRIFFLQRSTKPTLVIHVVLLRLNNNHNCSSAQVYQGLSTYMNTVRAEGEKK